MKTRKNTFNIRGNLPVIISLSLTAVILIFSITSLCVRYKNDVYYSEKVIANKTSEETNFTDKIGAFDLAYTESTHYYNFEYIYNGNSYEFKAAEKEIPFIMRYLLPLREKTVILLNPDNPTEKIFAQSNGKLQFFILGLSAIVLSLVLILVRQRQ